ncbi:MAG: hypothetical protein KJ042_07895, partial [Deltaproteobacteria bacterium]|nr:hypothetical protein [Deltaproteobacteria bacterium]
MNDAVIDPFGANETRPDRIVTFKHFVDRVLDWTRTDLSRAEYLDNLCRLLAWTLRCDEIELRVLDHEQIIRARWVDGDGRTGVDLCPCVRDAQGARVALIDGDVALLADV